MELDQITYFIRQEIEIYGDEIAIPRPKTIDASKANTEPIKSPEQPLKSSTNFATTTASLDVRHATSLESLFQTIKECRQCSLGQNRTHLVFGTGNPQADIVLLGEQPLKDDDASGNPFAGEAGFLLDNILKSISLNREELYLVNIVKCHTPGNRELRQEEIRTCLPYLLKQLSVIRPKFILCLGRTAANPLLEKDDSLSQLRGRAHHALGAQVIVTYNPITLIRYPKFKRETWEDVKFLRRLYDQYLKNPV
jgi:uracil-DNA glycosylase